MLLPPQLGDTQRNLCIDLACSPSESIFQNKVWHKAATSIPHKRKAAIIEEVEQHVLTMGNAVVGCLEIFSGSAKLTKTFRGQAVKCTAIDNLRNTASSLVPYLRLDLTVAADQQRVLQMLESGKV